MDWTVDGTVDGMLDGGRDGGWWMVDGTVCVPFCGLPIEAEN